MIFNEYQEKACDRLVLVLLRLKIVNEDTLEIISMWSFRKQREYYDQIQKRT